MQSTRSLNRDRGGRTRRAMISRLDDRSLASARRIRVDVIAMGRFADDAVIRPHNLEKVRLKTAALRRFAARGKPRNDSADPQCNSRAVYAAVPPAL